MMIASLTEKEIDRSIKNHERLGKETGGRLTLVELRLERSAALPPFPPREVSKAVVGLAQKSEEAVANICNDVRALGVDVGPDPRAFVLD